MIKATILVATLVAVASAQTARVRKEVRCMSDTEWDNFARALNAVERDGDYDSIALKHGQLFRSGIHNSDIFLPWHRQMLLELEDLLRSKVSGVTLPYWDWTLDAANPDNAPVFAADRYGGFSRSNGACITDGSFANFGNCVTRATRFQLDNGFSRSDVNSAIRRSRDGNYQAMRRGVEGVHNLVHVGVGGQMNSAVSPRDPIFYAHHAMIDKIWEDYQRRNEAENRIAYTRNADDDLIGYPGVKASDMFESKVRYASSNCNLRNSNPGRLRQLAEALGGWLDRMDILTVGELETVARTCPAPVKPASGGGLFWTSAVEEAIAWTNDRVNLDLEGSEGSCLNLPTIQKAVLAAEDAAAGDDQGLPPVALAGIGFAGAGLLAASALFVRSRMSSEEEIPQQSNNNSGRAIAVSANPRYQGQHHHHHHHQSSRSQGSSSRSHQGRGHH